MPVNFCKINATQTLTFVLEKDVEIFMIKTWLNFPLTENLFPLAKSRLWLPSLLIMYQTKKPHSIDMMRIW